MVYGNTAAAESDTYTTAATSNNTTLLLILLEISYYTQLKYSYLLTTFRCRQTSCSRLDCLQLDGARSQ